jgi:F420-non-reducing hydrogenase iron-sulfur subunit
MAIQYEPVIVGFLCNWCAYRAADLIGMTRHGYAPNMRSIRVLCTSRVEPEFVLKAFREGADGVLIFGCHPGECHYGDRNIATLRRVALLRRLLVQFGVERERLEVVWAAASEGEVLANAVDGMTRKIQSLGPLRWNESLLDGFAVPDPAGESPPCAGKRRAP